MKSEHIRENKLTCSILVRIDIIFSTSSGSAPMSRMARRPKEAIGRRPIFNFSTSRRVLRKSEILQIQTTAQQRGGVLQFRKLENSRVSNFRRHYLVFHEIQRVLLKLSTTLKIDLLKARQARKGDDRAIRYLREEGKIKTHHVREAISDRGDSITNVLTSIQNQLHSQTP